MKNIEPIPSLGNLLTIVTGHKKIIVAPLDWGLGHATRSIPIIDYLLKNDIEVIIAAENGPLEVLQKQFPQLAYFQLGAKPIQYRTRNMILNMLLQSPKLIRNYHNDRKSANHIAKLTGATCIITDNRFGFYASSTVNIYITHQINIHHKVRFFSKVASWMHRRVMSHFDSIIIPDYMGSDSLAGELSSSNLPNAVYIGPVTRIKALEKPILYDIVMILSGVEPARTLFEVELMSLISQLSNYKIVLIRGSNQPLSRKLTETKNSHIKVIDFANSAMIEGVLNTSRLLIARPGYTTLMDINNLSIPAILIPTPGQTEQEYLANNSTKNKRYYQLTQDKLAQLPTLIDKILLDNHQLPTQD